LIPAIGAATATLFAMYTSLRMFTFAVVAALAVVAASADAPYRVNACRGLSKNALCVAWANTIGSCLYINGEDVLSCVSGERRRAGPCLATKNGPPACWS
jgi:hypothetical protein